MPEYLKNKQPAESSPASMEVDIQFALLAAKTAGGNTLKWFRNLDLEVSAKGDGSPVTEADRTTEELVRKLISEKFPNDTIVGEEFGRTEGSSGRIWSIDPIDGTISFISGVPTYSTLLALGTENSSENNYEHVQWNLGVIYIPALNEMIYAYRSETESGGCWFQDAHGNQTQAQVSKTKKIKNAKVVASGADYVPQEIIQDAGIFRTWGDGYGYLLLATGQVDAMLDITLSVWDYAPLQVIIEEAGGKFLEWKDAPSTENRENKKEKSTHDCIDRISTNGVLDLNKYVELGS